VAARPWACSAATRLGRRGTGHDRANELDLGAVLPRAPNALTSAQTAPVRVAAWYFHNTLPQGGRAQSTAASPSELQYGRRWALDNAYNKQHSVR
jgi:hypothetical protein